MGVGPKPYTKALLNPTHLGFRVLSLNLTPEAFFKTLSPEPQALNPQTLNTLNPEHPKP